VFLREAIIDEASQRSGLDKAILRGEKKPLVIAAARRVVPPTTAQTTIPVEELTLLRLAAEVPEARSRMLASETLDFFSHAETARRWLERMEASDPDAGGAARWVDEWDDEASRASLAKVFV